jgi:hypothetical protein
MVVLFLTVPGVRDALKDGVFAVAGEHPGSGGRGTIRPSSVDL